jgi:hypothetical protein
MSLKPAVTALIVLLAVLVVRPALAFDVGSGDGAQAVEQGPADQGSPSADNPPAAYHYSNTQFNFSMSRSATPDGTITQRQPVSPTRPDDRPGLFQRMYQGVFGR